MTAKTAEKNALTVITGRWEESSRKLATLAGVFPAENYETKPVDGVRTFGATLRHVAFWNQYVSEALRGKNPDGTANELSGKEYVTKVAIVAALEKSAAEVTALLKGAKELDPDTIETVISFIEHTSEHYGQLAVYARWQGIVPPASRG